MIAALLVFVDRNARAEHDLAAARATGRGGFKMAAASRAHRLREVLELVDDCVAADLEGKLVEGSPLVDELTEAARMFDERPGFQERWLR